MCSFNRYEERNVKRLNNVINKFFERRKLLDGDDTAWEIRESGVGGFGVFVTRDVDVGEVIFQDFPVILGPRCVPNCPKICVSCFSNLNLCPCERGCGLDICSEICQNSLVHLKECKIIRQYCKLLSQKIPSDDFRKDIFENLTPIRSLFLEENDRKVISCLIAHNRNQHGHEIDLLKDKLKFQFKEDEEKIMRFVCCVLDANAFEVAIGNEECQSSVRGLYPLASLANHSCVPNTTHVFNNKQEMVVKATVFIPKNSEIFHSYTRIIWGTTTRLYHLHQTKHFICRCSRCEDPTEFRTYLSSILCKLCKGIVSPVNPYKAFAKWQCQDCKKIILGKDTKELITLLGSILKNIKHDDFTFMWNFLNGKLKSVVPETNQVAIELKYKIVWVLGHKNGYKWDKLTLDQLEIKQTICDELLLLLEKLRCGQCKMRGLLLYELFCCKREIIYRTKLGKQHSVSNACHGIEVSNELLALLNEAAAILEYDVTAPDEIKNLLKGNQT